MYTALTWFAVVSLAWPGGGRPQKQTWTFADARIGKLPSGWSSTRTGQGPGSVWKVIEDRSAPSGTKVLAQTSSAGLNRIFNLCVADHTRYKDVDLRVSFKANTGKLDQGGGPVWRYQDARNYYVCRMNPLEDNFRIYKVIAGRRSELVSLDVKVSTGKWHTIRARMHGDRIVCSIDGKELTARDRSLEKSGQVGLWTKSDAVTSFDDFRVSGR